MSDKRRIKIYVSGKYSGPKGKEEDYVETQINTLRARTEAIRLWEAGYTALTPHLNTMHFQFDCKCSYEDYT